jgi:A/G-specific adenine glycosylase
MAGLKNNIKSGMKENPGSIEISKAVKRIFHTELMYWAEANPRKMPWLGEKDPYKIWLSEIILQQTRVAQGREYYIRFLTNYPNVKALANASLDEVLLLWEGLGYYTRARNLWFTAKVIVREMGGVFPNEYEDILRLKGIGPYTAAAIASFAFNRPVAVLDGNVFRVLARFLGLCLSPGSTTGTKQMTQIANELINRLEPGRYNQSIMNLGAMVCLPKKPECKLCPFNKHCFALKHNAIENLPVKKKKIKIKTRHFHFWVLHSHSHVYIEQRKNGDIWHSLFQFPVTESEKDADIDELWSKYGLHENPEVQIVFGNERFVQQLTHQKIIARFHIVSMGEWDNSVFQKVNIRNLGSFAFPKIVKDFIKKDKLFLTLNH